MAPSTRKNLLGTLPALAGALLLSCSAPLLVLFTHTDDIESWEWALHWYVEDDSGLSGPFDSGGSGVVNLGPVSGPPVHLSRTLANFVFTAMNVPLEPVVFYTGENTISPSFSDVTVTLENAGLGDELLLFYPFVNWWSIDQSPYSLTQSFSGVDVVDNDGEVSVFVSYRSDEGEEPSSRYDFRLGLSPAELADVSFDAAALRTRTPVRSWQSSVELRNSDTPYLLARRKGVHLITGESRVDPAGTSGTIGIPAAFPAERWYLVSGSPSEAIVREFDPADPSPIVMEPLAGWIDDTTMAIDAGQGRFSVSAPGVGPVDFGLLLLACGTGYWEICFPGSALQVAGDTLTLSLPAYPLGPTPSFDSARLELYRLDGATPREMFRHRWNPRSNPLPSYAMQSEFSFL